MRIRQMGAMPVWQVILVKESGVAWIRRLLFSWDAMPSTGKIPWVRFTLKRHLKIVRRKLLTV